MPGQEGESRGLAGCDAVILPGQAGQIGRRGFGFETISRGGKGGYGICEDDFASGENRIGPGGRTGIFHAQEGFRRGPFYHESPGRRKRGKDN